VEVKFSSSMSIPLCALLCATAFGQAAVPAPQPQTFHVRGTITDPTGALIPRINVTFQGEQLTKTVTTNEVGVYEADLPLGVYSMTTQGRGFVSYRRPLFRVTSPTTAVLNATLSIGNPCGDMVIGNSSGRPVTDEEMRAATEHCRRDEVFEIPAADGAKFQLSIRYGSREGQGTAHSYTGEKTRQYETPVFVAYNLFSLRADKVAYDEKSRIVEASGNVVVEDESGTSRPADHASFKMVDGRAKRR
jgi:hypothetical protein